MGIRMKWNKSAEKLPDENEIVYAMLEDGNIYIMVGDMVIVNQVFIPYWLPAAVMTHEIDLPNPPEE
jgi:hypothetical protein